MGFRGLPLPACGNGVPGQQGRLQCCDEAAGEGQRLGMLVHDVSTEEHGNHKWSEKLWV